MPKLTRRNCFQATLAAAAATRAPRAVAAIGPNRAQARPGPTIKLAEILGPNDKARWKLAKQVGVNHAIAGVSNVLAKVPRTQYREVLAKLKAEYQEAGLTIAGVESHPV